MKRSIALIVSLVIMFVLSGCVQRPYAQEVSPTATHYVMKVQRGTIESIRPVVIKDNGTGAFLGAITGAVLGSMIGKGKGKTLATLGGGLAGAYVGSELAKANAQELTILLDNGEEVVVVVKGLRFYPGERVRIVTKESRVISVEPLR
ncbi:MULTISPECIES: glycine zipper 2TM domain-containing protein [unclassified Nitratiruptor]|uniref:glycine zipper 2TM domain-containing protein n=1 Tax=unclassified Nitratiruptor TaxID=2624044 RepID=UPI0019151FC0|nr:MULTISPECIES: glycine zipper 2TM domain-containing protein [unclassified Nitratiruptor]BCD60212.1 outer membrane lipoprotein SlyB [Nitratiruptor sp. YY08-10]BCD64299.1 outer membrane lipoprotein SlyB [Nitratiruptor sp. YY08-14]